MKQSSPLLQAVLLRLGWVDRSVSVALPRGQSSSSARLFVICEVRLVSRALSCARVAAGAEDERRGCAIHTLGLLHSIYTYTYISYIQSVSAGGL